MTSTPKRLLVGFLLFIILIALGGWWSLPSEKPNHIEIAKLPPPTHIEWDEFPVGGMILVDPAEADSAGNHKAAMIPAGSVLEVPHLVKGEDPGKS